MKVRFVLPAEDEGKPLFDRTVGLPAVPEPGETVGIDFPEGYPMAGTGVAWLVEVETRRWYIDGEDPIVEVWLTEETRTNQYVHSGCRYGYEQMMAAPGAASYRRREPRGEEAG